MDLSFIQEQLKTFDTFASNIGDALQLIPTLLGDIWSFITGFEGNAETTENAFDGLSSADVGGTVDAGDTDGTSEGSSLSGSSENDN